MHKGLGSPEILSTYNSERLPVVALMLLATAELYTQIVLKTADETEAPTADSSKSGFFNWRNEALSQLDINYRWSPLAVDFRGTGGLSADELSSTITYTNSSGQAHTSRVDDLVTHVAMHGHYHRGQAAMELRAAGHNPAVTDYIHATRNGLID